MVLISVLFSNECSVVGGRSRLCFFKTRGYVISRQIDVDQVNARIRQLGELFEIVAAVDDARVEQRGASDRVSHDTGRLFSFGFV